MKKQNIITVAVDDYIINEINKIIDIAMKNPMLLKRKTIKSDVIRLVLHEGIIAVNTKGML